MPRTLRCLLFTLAILAGRGSNLSAQTQVAPFYSLPKDGDWIEFEWRATSPDKKDREGTLRISSVGEQKLEGKSHRWIEVKKVSKHGQQVDFKLRKVLIAERAFTAGQPLELHVARGFGQKSPDAPVINLTRPRLHELLSLGMDGVDTTLVKVSENEEVETKLGKYKTRHLSATGKSGERVLKYHGWLTNEVPFGCIKFDIHERIGLEPLRPIFSAVAVRRGHDAKSELDEGKAK